jgi:rhodanese-related sulfurtransferase
MSFRTALLGLALAATAASASSPLPDVVSLDEARARFEAGEAILIDVREPREHATGVAAGARLLPMSQINQRLAEIPTDAGKPVFLICNSQNRSPVVLRALRNTGGYGHVRYVHGGMSEWAKRGWPMVKPGG